MPASTSPNTTQPVMTGLSGNEIYCLHKKSIRPGPIVVGNSVMAMGFVSSMLMGLRVMLGGEVSAVTELIAEGRRLSYQRLEEEARRAGAHGVTGVTNELIFLGSNIEFIAIGSGLAADAPSAELFTTAGNGQALYCQLDSGFAPRRYVFGNCAYSVGLARSAMGGLRSLVRGEVKEYSEAFTRTRHLALERLEQEARQVGANAVVGINTAIVPIWGMQEMLVQGTASYHPGLGPDSIQHPVTSDLTNQEMWNCMNMGYMPIKLVLGVSVYSLGLKSKVTSVLKGLVRGEIPELTQLVYEARDNALTRLREQAIACGADDLLGIKTYVYSLKNGMIEMVALGTAVKKMPTASTASSELPIQAIIDEQDTYIDAGSAAVNTSSRKADKSGNSGVSLLNILLKLLGS
jgi:uncharacterized protein YbjQ (UPF0145 family)